MEREPSVDGSTEGKIIWYDYDEKNFAHYEPNGSRGGVNLPGAVVKVLSDSSTWYTRYQRDSWGHPTNVISTYTSGTNVLTRTNQFVYSTNGFDLIKEISAGGTIISSNLFNGAHQIELSYNALNEITRYSYNGKGQLSGIRRPSGLTTTNLYFTTGSYSNWLDKTIDWLATTKIPR